MLKPAAIYKQEIERKSQELYYTEDYFYYMGYLGNERIIVAEDPGETLFQFASVDKNGNVIGYISFRYDRADSVARNFGWISFDKGNVIVVKDLYELLDMLQNKWKVHRIEWQVIDPNPVKKHYDQYCLEHGGYIHHFHDVVKDLEGNYHDAYSYEIIAQKKERRQTNDTHKQHWILCSDQLPTNDDWVIITILDERGDTPWRYTDLGWYLEAAKCWIVEAEQRTDVIAWMPLPKPWREDM